jgi:hypothetical protein
MKSWPCETAWGISKLDVQLQQVQIVCMKTSVDLDQDLAAEIERTVSLIHEKPATVLRMAIRAGLPLVTGGFQSPRPDGCFSEAYRDIPEKRVAPENSFAESMKVSPER